MPSEYETLGLVTTAGWQMPPRHSPPEQSWPQIPQFLPSVLVLTQAPPHSLGRSAGQLQAPAEQVPPVLQEIGAGIEHRPVPLQVPAACDEVLVAQPAVPHAMVFAA